MKNRRYWFIAKIGPGANSSFARVFIFIIHSAINTSKNNGDGVKLSVTMCTHVRHAAAERSNSIVYFIARLTNMVVLQRILYAYVIVYTI